MFGRQRRRIDSRQGRYVLRLEPRERDLIRQLLGELRELLALGAGRSARAPAVPRRLRRRRQELEDEYRRLTRDELQSGRLASVDAVEATVDAELLTPNS